MLKTKLVLCLALLLMAAPTILADEEIKNTKQSAGYTLELVEELRFGAEEEDEEYLWPAMGTKILPAPKGHVYVVDPAANKILEFDAKGKYNRTATSQGRGPGEIQQIIAVTQAHDGSILLTDADPTAPGAMPRLLRFNPDMSYRDMIDTTGMGFRPALINISPDGKYLGGTFVKIDMSAGATFLKTGVIDLESKEVIGEYNNIKQPFPDMTRINDQEMWVGFIAEQFKTLYKFGVFTFAHDNTAYTGLSADYKVMQYKPGNDKPLRTISREYKPYPLGSDEKQAMIDFFWEQIPPQGKQLISKNTLQKGVEAAELPPRKTPIYGLLPIEDKGFMVIHNVDLKTRDTLGDVFDNSGKFLCQVKMPDYGLYAMAAGNPSPRIVFKDGKAYTIQTNDDGDNEAVVYKYSLKK